MKTVCVQTVGKGNVIKMKQKKTEDSIKRTAKPSVRKVGTMLGSGALAVLSQRQQLPPKPLQQKRQKLLKMQQKKQRSIT